jgi:uncharacterized protein YecE (DUF72 family)
MSSHDPGVVAAQKRSETVHVPRPLRVHAQNGRAPILIGTASWTDPTITAPGVFYPDDARTPEGRLRYYASRFSMVEVNSTYYALPARRMADLWVDRTPDEFIFDVKAHALMTAHPSEPGRLPPEIRRALPAELAKAKRIYPKDLPDEIRDEVWREFARALEPLRASGKLGAIFLQYPRWFIPNKASAAELEAARERLAELPVAVEFRHPMWLGEKLAPRTLALLERLGMSYVIVDEPQGTKSSVPPTVAITSSALVVFRMHGHRVDLWEKPNVPVVERFRYLYDREELAPWVPRIIDTAERAEQVHVVFNNCYANYGVTNADEIGEMLVDAEDNRDSGRQKR